jgi:hypothetical protein
MQAKKHFTCRHNDRKTMDQSIHLSYCREHDEILLHHDGAVLIYQTVLSEPPPPSPRESSCQKSFSALLPLIVIAIISCIMVTTPTDPKENYHYLPPNDQPQLNATERLRHSFFSFQQENMRTVSNTLQFEDYNESLLAIVIDQLVTTANNVLPMPPPCLCHHHLNSNFSLGGVYAAVCIIPLARNIWQPLVNPSAMAMEELYTRTNQDIISRRVIREDKSRVFKTDDRWRYNTFGIHSIWPSLSLSYYAEPLKISTIIHDSTAHCMALSLQEIDYLIKPV